MLRQSHFKFPHEYFHLNFKIDIYPLFKSLDWTFLCHNLNKCLSLWPSLELHALVMMDSHVHILFRIADQSENFFTAHLSELLGQKRPGEILVEPVKNHSQYLNTYKYIYRNPVEAGLSVMCESYSFSSLNTLLGQSEALVKTLDTMGVIQNPRRVLNWLNSDSNYKESKLNDLRQSNSFLM